jgi:hypothetical protein
LAAHIKHWYLNFKLMGYRSLPERFEVEFLPSNFDGHAHRRKFLAQAGSCEFGFERDWEEESLVHRRATRRQ